MKRTLGLVALGFAISMLASACAHGGAGAGSREGQPDYTPEYWESAIGRPSRPPPGTRIEGWPVIDKSGVNEIPPASAGENKGERGAERDVFRRDGSPTPVGPAAQIPLRTRPGYEP